MAKSSLGRVTTDLTWIKLEATRLLREYVKQGRPGETFFWVEIPGTLNKGYLS